MNTYLTDARRVINENGGLNGEDVTFAESEINATQHDQRKIQLLVQRRNDDVVISWAGGQGPYRVERDNAPDFQSPQVVVEGTFDTEVVDTGAASDTMNWYYRVTAS